MASLLYKDYLIVASADFDPSTKKWLALVTISWRNDGQQELHTLKSLKNCFDSGQDAEAFGVDTGKAWIDSRP